MRDSLAELQTQLSKQATPVSFYIWPTSEKMNSTFLYEYHCYGLAAYSSL